LTILFYLQCELAISKGYPCEEHIVATKDGFLLGVQRITFGRNESLSTTTEHSIQPVVFLQHGLLSSSFDWVSNLQNESLGMFENLINEICLITAI